MENALEKRLTDLYLSNADIIAEGLPASMNRPRSEALETFNLAGIPDRGSARGDRYHYTGLREVFGAEYESYFTPSYAGVEPVCEDLPGRHIPFLNGFCRAAEPLVEEPSGVIFGSLAEAAVRHPDLVGRHYDRLAGAQGDAVSALNTVFVQDGAFVYVPRGTEVAEPVVVTFARYGEGEALRTFSRCLFVFEEGSRARIVIDNRSQGGEAGLDCQVREVFVARGAEVEIVETIRANDRSSLVASCFAEQHAESRLHTLSVALGGRLLRSDLRVRLAEPGAENRTDGLMLCGAGEHVDFHTDIVHAAPDCTSRELFRGIASEGGTGVFSGRIYVAQDAQRTQAFQQSNNLLLGPGAHIYAKPQLEIYADNVKCSHGATVGQLNAEAVYYMRQRGISLHDARRLQMFGFAGQVIGRTPVGGVTETLEALAAAKIESM